MFEAEVDRGSKVKRTRQQFFFNRSSVPPRGAVLMRLVAPRGGESLDYPLNDSLETRQMPSDLTFTFVCRPDALLFSPSLRMLNVGKQGGLPKGTACVRADPQGGGRSSSG